MPLSSLLRILLAVGISLLFLLVLFLLLYLTQGIFEVWDHLKQTSSWFLAIYGGGVLVLASGAGWAVWRVLVPPPAKPKPAEPEALPPLSEQELEARVAKAEEDGIDVAMVRRELARLRERRVAGRIHASLFGEISSGKSSLIKALLPSAAVRVSARGGTTRTLEEYHWATRAGDELVLVDVPGTNEVGVELDEMSRAEALRSHLVIYVCDGDLTRTQYEELLDLLRLEKPCVLALNKTDRYSQAELEQLKARLRDRLAAYPRTELVGVRSGGQREAMRELPDGTLERVMRPMPPQVEELQKALQRTIDEDPQMLEQLRDSAVFSLVSQRLSEAEFAYRRQRSEEIVESYSKKAVVGALAAVMPGSDIIIQGYLGVSLVKELSDLYEIPVRKADRDKLLELVQKQVGKTLTLVLAVAGNALKAFPGVGTLAGGILHAVAYGLVFKSLGRAVARSFESRGELHPRQAARAFKETLGENLELSAGEFARLAIKIAREGKQAKANE